eukprot:TRINITY_DN8168_c0_g1_i2.p1 TRINITY_DN8168_c0_g1~~TRINITY_DN8168_c0_g1_i2.p1  ORF type:complete len:333 (+),score=47.95 TRINITY_DN8168_c0_g1_i2:61-999(+)
MPRRRGSTVLALPDAFRKSRHLTAKQSQIRLEEAHAEVARCKAELIKVKSDLGPTNPDTLTSMSKYATALFQATDYKAAEEIQRYVFDTSARVLGGQHPDTLLAMDNLAVTIRHRGKRREAVELAQTASKLKHAFGMDSPSVTAVFGNLATSSYLGGDTKSAIEIEQQLFETRQKSLGPDHPDTLHVMSNLAASLKDTGDYRAAEGLYREMLQVRQRTLGPHDVKTITTMKTLAACLKQLGDTQGAADVQFQILEVEKQKLGPRHPRTLNTMQQLASNLREHGDASRADELEYHVRSMGKVATREDQAFYGR